MAKYSTVIYESQSTSSESGDSEDEDEKQSARCGKVACASVVCVLIAAVCVGGVGQSLGPGTARQTGDATPQTGGATPQTPASPAHVAVYPHEIMDCPAGAVLTTPTMTFAMYDTVAASVAASLVGIPSQCTAVSCPQADWAGCVLRMAGHDFMDFANGEGGSDACTDIAESDNAGLQACLLDGEHGASLHSTYQLYCTQVSLADFLVIAAESVMTVTRSFWTMSNPSAPTIDFRSGFKFGRTTATACPFAEGRLPNPENGCSAVETTFLNGMGLDWTRATALMGVHTLGRARIANSGYDGWWSDPEHSRMFNNNYYVVMLAKGWIPERAINGNSAKNQWERSDVGRDSSTAGHEMMLDTDLCLAYDGPNARGGQPLKASTQNCCAWAGLAEIPRVVANNKGDYCGVTNTNPRGGAGAQRTQCCGRGFGPQQDCGDFRKPGGVAYDTVKLYAEDEVAWIRDFLQAWRHATENGFQLTPLSA
eukprot:TRINITY_DN3234_c0_g1_i1.p1 TRINITY_DN3234_c0_g1~~TRINITY_DN3234_c0_g1_i1.p1  ORF type:complete len:493 (-),score=75.59 TRINITY_DN3234_c0_g1_i1:130-1572(-)